LQESGRRDGENTGELGMATEQDIARRRRLGLRGGRGLSLVCCNAVPLREPCALGPLPLQVSVCVLQKWPFERGIIYVGSDKDALR
jgi:hypothetical protein